MREVDLIIAARLWPILSRDSDAASAVTMEVMRSPQIDSEEGQSEKYPHKWSTPHYKMGLLDGVLFVFPSSLRPSKSLRWP
jgi:hypothetical protein